MNFCWILLLQKKFAALPPFFGGNAASFTLTRLGWSPTRSHCILSFVVLGMANDNQAHEPSHFSFLVRPLKAFFSYTRGSVLAWRNVRQFSFQWVFWPQTWDAYSEERGSVASPWAVASRERLMAAAWFYRLPPRALHRNPSGVAYLAPQDAKLRVASTHFSKKNLFYPKLLPLSPKFWGNI